MRKKKEKEEEKVEKKVWEKTWFLLELEEPGISKRVRGKYTRKKIQRIIENIDTDNYMIWSSGDKEWSSLTGYKIGE